MKKFLANPNRVSITLMVLIGVMAAIKPIEASVFFRVMAYVVGVAIICVWLRSLIAWLRRLMDSRENVDSSSKRGYVKYFAYLLVAAPLILVFLTLEGDYVGRRMPIYAESLKAAQTSPTVSDDLGDPMRVGWPVDATWSGSACNLSIPLAGSRGSASLHVGGVKKNGSWEISDMYLVNKGSNLRIPISYPPTLR
jgi:Cytochrome oxidase complex assembly protein 1